MIKSRKTYLDVLRILACFLVIVNHTNSRIFFSVQPSVTWFISLTYFFVSKIAVPVFVMISGATLLKKEESYAYIIKKRILKILSVLVIFSFFYYVYGVVTTRSSFDVTSFVKSIYDNPITNAYWYLYMYLGLMTMLPFIRNMVRNFKQKDFLAFFSLWVVFTGVIPLINEIFKINSFSGHFSMPIFTVFIGYFILGHYLENELDVKMLSIKNIFMVTILGILSITYSIINSYAKYKQDSTDFLFMDNTSLITIIIPSIWIFTLVKFICSKIELNIRIQHIISNIGKATFGIYLLSDLIITRLDFIYVFLNNRISPLISIFILEIAVFIVGYIITQVLKKVFIIRKLI